jgi:hypothetical protein
LLQRADNCIQRRTPLHCHVHVKVSDKQLIRGQCLSLEALLHL